MPDPFDLFGDTGDTSRLPTTTRRGIPYEIERVPPPRQQWVRAANQTTAIVRVKDEQAFDFIEDMVGRTHVEGSSPSRELRRDLPEECGWVANQWCTRVEQLDAGEEWDDGSGPTTYDPETSWPAYRWVRYRCTFEGMPHKMLTDAEADDASAEESEAPELFRYVVRSRKTFVKEQQVPGGAWKIVDADPSNRKRLEQTGFKIVLMADVSYTVVRFPVEVLPYTALNALAGKINLGVWDKGPGGYRWQPGTLCFTGWDDDEKYFDANGDWVCDLVLRFRWRQIGFNHFMDQTWRPREVSKSGVPGGDPDDPDHIRPYTFTTSDNFNDLFKCEP